MDDFITVYIFTIIRDSLYSIMNNWYYYFEKTNIISVPVLYDKTRININMNFRMVYVVKKTIIPNEQRLLILQHLFLLGGR